MIKANLIKCLRSQSHLLQQQKFHFTYENKLLTYENEYMQRFLSSHSSFNARELGEVSRIISKHKPTDTLTWETYENCAMKHASSLEEIELRKVMSALIANERGSKELCSNLAARMKELGLKSSGVSEEDFQTERKRLSKLNPKAFLPLPMRIYLKGYDLRWKLFNFLQRFGLFFK